MTSPVIAPPNPTGSVLVVDDEAALRFPIAEVLRDAGLTVVEAGSGQEALDRLWDDRLIRLVFSDVRMPGAMDGIELAQIVEANFTDVSVILTSGNVPSQIDPYREIIAKPYSLERVADRIIQTLAHRR